VHKLLERNRQEFKILEKQSAQILRPEDPEQKFFRSRVLKPAQLQTCTLYRLIEKTLMLDVGSMY
jgi:hypothetical protein